MNPLFPRRTANSILGLSLERGRLEAVVLRRTNGSVELQHSLSAALSLPTLAGDPTLVGREIRQQLDQAGIRERRCVVCLPSTWVLSLQVRLPELPEADLQDLLQVEAERGFPVSPDALILAESRFRSPAGEPFATLLAIPRDTIARLEAVLTAAQLRPVSFCPSTTALPAPTEPGAPAELAFAGGGEALALRVWAGGGLVLLRTLEGIVEHDGAETQFQPEALLRELRITLGQLPDALRNAIRQVRVFGQDDLTEELFETLQPQLEGWGMTSERALAWKPADAPLKLPADAPVSPAFSLALRWLAGRGAPFEFLPPRVSAWKRLSDRYASRRLAGTGITAGALALLAALAFLVQQVQLWRWEGRWQAIAADVAELESTQQRIRQYRPWFDDSVRSLTVLRRLTEAFPEDGSVAAKSVELRGPAAVLCTGTAQDRAALIAALDKLRALPEVQDVKVEQMRGRSPVEFTFNFRWIAAGTP